MKKAACVLCMILTGLLSASGCGHSESTQKRTRVITDQLGRTVTVPVHPKRIAALHHFGGKIIFALKQQHLLVEKSLYGREGQALADIDPSFARLPGIVQSHGYNVEGLVSLNPQLIFCYTSMDTSEIELFEHAGIPVVAVKGENFEESFHAVRLMSEVMGCREEGEFYIKTCREILSLVESRLKNRVTTPIRVMFAGPRSIYSVATGNMLQTPILERSGAVNVAEQLRGFWADVSPEQIVRWNPDVIFLGSYLDVYGRDRILENPQFQTVTAIRNKKVYEFPSNIGWWDYPAPHCVLGVVWSAKTLYPDLFSDIDMTALADEFYQQFVGYSFEELGGRL